MKAHPLAHLEYITMAALHLFPFHVQLLAANFGLHSKHVCHFKKWKEKKQTNTFVNVCMCHISSVVCYVQTNSKQS